MAAMIEIRSSPRLYARIAGLLYLLTIVLGAAEEFAIRSRILVPGDAASTAANLRSMESLWRLGIASELFLGICTIVFALILYALLKPVSKDLSLLMTFFGLTAIAVETAFALRLVDALSPLGNAAYLKAFSPQQLDAMASLAIRGHAIGFGIALLFFGPFFLIAGYLIFESGFFPRALGVLYLIPGVSYMASSFALILAPAFAGRYYFVMAGPAVIGEGAVCLWLLAKGLDVERWRARAARSRDLP
jgi:uncharacterized protein DUF4386